MVSQVKPVVLLLFAALVFPTIAVAQNASFEIVTESASGPPYPTGNVVVKLLEADEMGGLDHTATVRTSFGIISDKALPKLLEAATKGKVANQEFVQYDLVYDGDGTDLQPDSIFDVTFRTEFQGQPGTMPELLVEEMFESDGSLVASVNIGGHKAGGGGTGVGRVGGKMHLEDISLGIIAPAVIHSAPNSFFDIFFRMHLDDPSQILPNQTLARLTFTAATVPEPASAALLALGVCGLVGYGIRRRVPVPASINAGNSSVGWLRPTVRAIGRWSQPILVALFAAWVANSPSEVSAATIIETQPYGAQQSPFDQTLTFNRFDPALGTLNSVGWSISMTSSGGSLTADNDAATAATVQGAIGANITLSLPSGVTTPNVPGMVASNVSLRVANLAADDGDGAGVVDSTAPDGVHWTNLPTQVASASANASVLTDYIGTSTFNVLARVTNRPPLDFVSGASPTDIELDLTPVTASGTFQLEYDYTPIPEPASLALLALGIGVAVGYGRRRRRRSEILSGSQLYLRNFAFRPSTPAVAWSTVVAF